MSASGIRFAVIGINHNHILGQVDAVLGAGAEFVAFFAEEDDLAAPFSERYPQAERVRDIRRILEDNSIALVLSAAIPKDRARIGIEVMRHGKDYMVDKPGMISLDMHALTGARMLFNYFRIGGVNGDLNHEFMSRLGDWMSRAAEQHQGPGPGCVGGRARTGGSCSRTAGPAPRPPRRGRATSSSSRRPACRPRPPSRCVRGRRFRPDGGSSTGRSRSASAP